MKILYLDLGSPGESYSSKNCNRYGGIRIFAAHAKQYFEDFTIIGGKECFEDYTDEDRGNRIIISEEEKQALINGMPLQFIVKNLNDYDILCHHHSQIYIQTADSRVKTCIWCVGVHNTVHPFNKNVLLFNPKWQNPQLQAPDHKLYRVSIGQPVPEFQEYQKEKFIFQCSNQHSCFQILKLIDLCQSNKLELVLGGPIDCAIENEFKARVNKGTVSYLGVLPQKEKIDLTKRARCHTLLHNFNISWTLSGLEALAYNCPIIASNLGFWPDFIDGKNGLLVRHPLQEKEFIEAYEQVGEISQKNCWQCARNNDSIKMIKDFERAFQEILNE